MKATGDIVGVARGGGPIRVRLSDEMPIGETLGDGNVLSLFLIACSSDAMDAVRLDGWPAGTLTGEELATGTVSEGGRTGFAEMRLQRGKRSRLERSMLLGLSWFLFGSKVYGSLDRRELRRGDFKKADESGQLRGVVRTPAFLQCIM